MAKIAGLKAKLEKHPDRAVPRRIYDIEMNASKAEPAEIAASLLKKIAPSLGIADLSQVKFDKVKDSVLGSHVLYQQYMEGKPISGAWLRVDIDHDGRVYNVLNDLLPQKTLQKAEKTEVKKAQAAAEILLSADEAKSRALAAAGAEGDSSAEILDSELVYYQHNGSPTLAWKTIVKATSPEAEWKMYLDARSGAVLEKTNLLRFVEGQGRVFDPNPVVALGDTTLEDSSQISLQAYVDVTIRDLNGSGVLDGPFVSTRTTLNRVQRTSHQFLFTRGDRGFKEVMAYFHIDRVQRYIQDLGFNNILNHAIEVNIDGTTDDNSFYSPTTKSLTFGTGGVDDAEDAEIILHEYGHAIQDNQVPGFGASAEAGAMGEGFGDFLAASFFADVKPQALRPTLGNWDAVAYSGAEPPCLRRLDSNKKYPKDIRGEVHDDGEIWSACLWEIRGALGRKAAERLVLAHHFLLTRDAKFEDAAKALITADQQLNQGRNETLIRDVFVRRGILPNAKRGNKRAGTPFAELNGNFPRK
jgi:Zn-dependent metalloprotease